MEKQEFVMVLARNGYAGRITLCEPEESRFAQELKMESDAKELRAYLSTYLSGNKTAWPTSLFWTENTPENAATLCRFCGKEATFLFNPADSSMSCLGCITKFSAEDGKKICFEMEIRGPVNGIELFF